MAERDESPECSPLRPFPQGNSTRFEHRNLKSIYVQSFPFFTRLCRVRYIKLPPLGKHSYRVTKLLLIFNNNGDWWKIQRHLPYRFLHVCYIFVYHKVRKTTSLAPKCSIEMVEWFGKHLQLIFRYPSLKPVQHISCASSIIEIPRSEGINIHLDVAQDPIHRHDISFSAPTSLSGCHPKVAQTRHLVRCITMDHDMACLVDPSQLVTGFSWASKLSRCAQMAPRQSPFTYI